ncbi:MAG: hypothetical protein WAV31_01035 [Candidatus Moraniibacteriota bacterium]
MNKKINKKKSRKGLFIRGKGSLLIGVMIVFLMISAIALAIISRTLQGIQLTTDSKKGYTTYQQSDQTVEGFLSKLNELDSGTDAGYADNQIPENTLATSFCSGVQCFKGDGTTAPAGTDKVTTIFNSQSDVTDQGVTRSVYAPVSDRVDGMLTNGSLTVTKCGGGGSCSWNRCEMLVRVNDNQATVPGGVVNYEVRMSSGNNDTGSLENGANAGEYGWIRVLQRTAPVNSFFTRNQTRLIESGDPELPGTATTGGQYNEKYFFAIKARNSTPFKLDSLYHYDPNDAIQIEGSADCTGGSSLSGLGCIFGSVDGAGAYGGTHNCCNGSHCLSCMGPEWVSNAAKTCCLQTCTGNYHGYLDGDNYRGSVISKVEEYPSGNNSGDGVNGGVGFCGVGKAVNCLSGASCTKPRRTVGYCTGCPPNDVDKDQGINSSVWTLTHDIDVDMNGGEIPNPLYPPTLPPRIPTPGNVLTKSRCCSRPCPSPIITDSIKYCGALTTGMSGWNVSGTTCTKGATDCNYTLTKSCKVICSAGYHPNASETCCIQNSCSTFGKCTPTCGNCYSPTTCGLMLCPGSVCGSCTSGCSGGDSRYCC